MEKTQEEKIDYIYNHIKTEKKFLYARRITKVLMYVFFIGYIVYFYMYGFEKFKNSIIISMKPNINTESMVEGVKDTGGELIEKVKVILNGTTNNFTNTLSEEEGNY